MVDYAWFSVVHSVPPPYPYSSLFISDKTVLETYFGYFEVLGWSFPMEKTHTNIVRWNTGMKYYAFVAVLAQ